MIKSTLKGICLCLLSIAVFSINSISAIAQVKLSEELWNLPTYKVEPSDKAPIFFTKGTFQGASRVIYPYALNDVISGEKTKQDWKALVLENEYIKLGITPDIGGKLYYATDKTSDYNFIYKNNEVKPGNIGMTGAWVSGGIEWCVFHHHRASTFLPMDYHLQEKEDGSKTIFIGETEPRHGMRWTVGVSVYPGKSYFEAELSVYNPTPFTNSFLYWANVAAHTNKDFQTIFPPSVNLATYHSKTEFTRWPVSTEVYRRQDFTEGVDISWWKNVKKSASFFAHDLQEDFMGAYDHGKHCGVVHVGDHNIIKGAKLWEWGSGARGQSTEGRLTETSGPYVEIMVGAFSDNQPDYSWIRPYEVKRWKQYWYPVRDIEGFKNANIKGAVNLEERKGNKVFLGYHLTQKVNKARVILKNKETIILEKEIAISPDNSFTDLIKMKGDYKLTDLYTEIKDVETDEVLVSYQPKEINKVDKLPQVVDKPAMPEEIESVEELFLTGNRIEQFYKNASVTPMDYYREALKRDPMDIKTNMALGTRCLKNGNYPKARSHFSKAIKRVTNDYTRPSSCEALYMQGITLKKLGLYTEAIDTLYRSTWDYAYHAASFFELAQLSCIQRDFKKALEQIDESLSTNARNNRAVALKASILRKLGKYNEAMTILGELPVMDPLNFRIANEQYLIFKESEQSIKADESLKKLSHKLRDFKQNYLELAVGYINEGMYDEANEILMRFKGEDPMVAYYLGFVNHHKGNENLAVKWFKKGSVLSEDYCFPYRLETIEVLKTALNYNASDGKAYYYLGNILYDKQPKEAIKYWEQSVKYLPELAIAHRNLGWGYNDHLEDLDKAIVQYEKAIALNDQEAIYYRELDILYEQSNVSIEKRLALFDGKNAVVRKRDDSFVRMMNVLTLADQPEKVMEFMVGKTFSYKEGTSRVRENIINAHLVYGLRFFKDKKYEEALSEFLLAQVPDEEAGSSRFGNRTMQVNYFIAQAYDALKDKKNAMAFYKESVGINSEHSRGFMNYYKGLSLLKLGKTAEANAIFETLIAEGDDALKGKEADDAVFYMIFNEKQFEDEMKSRAYTIRGLGYKGLNKSKQAKADLQKAEGLFHSNLWAKMELEDM